MCRSWVAARATAVAWAAGRLLRRAKPAGNSRGSFGAVAGAEGDRQGRSCGGRLLKKAKPAANISGAFVDTVLT